MGLVWQHFWSFAVLVILGLCNGQGDFWRVGSLALQHQYDCGEYGMQLLVFPRRGYDIRFKVVDEFGTAFDVTNCSICRHWVTSNDGVFTFSAGYRGCQVLNKDGRNYLQVRVEELTSSKRVVATHDLIMICPKQQEQVPEPEDNMRLMRPAPQPHSGVGRPAQQPQPHPGLGRPAQQPQPHPGMGRPAPQPQPRPGVGRPAPQPQPHPGVGRPAPQPQPRPGVGRPAPQPQPRPGVGRPAPQPQPRPGVGLPVPQPQPHPGVVPPPPYFIGSPPTWEQCQVSSGKIPCADALGPSSCSQAGCCYDDRDQTAPCYYGNTVTVQCLQDGHFILAVSRDMLDYPIVLDSVRLSYAQSGCDPVKKTEAFLVFRFPLTHCGTTVQVTGGRLIYENQLVSGIDILSGPDGSITRDSIFILDARCIYNATDFLPVQVEVVLPPTPAPVFQVGPLRLELRIAKDSSYSSYYSDTDYPVVKVLRDPVHVEVRILQRMDPSLVLVLHECWATPNTNPLEQLQWPILVAGCPFEGDNYRTQLVPLAAATSELRFPTHYQRFIISTFAFMDSELVDSTLQSVLDGLVYLFCSVSVCHTSQREPCRIACPVPVAPRRRRYLEFNETESLNIVSTHGAVIFQGNRRAPAKQVKEDKDTASDTDLTLMLLVVLPLLGCILFVVLVIWKKRRMTKF